MVEIFIMSLNDFLQIRFMWSFILEVLSKITARFFARDVTAIISPARLQLVFFKFNTIWQVPKMFNSVLSGVKLEKICGHPIFNFNHTITQIFTYWSRYYLLAGRTCIFVYRLHINDMKYHVTIGDANPWLLWWQLTSQIIQIATTRVR